MVNPIVSFLFYFEIAISIVLCKTWIGLGIFIGISIILLFFNKKYFKQIFSQVKPFILFLPIFILIYIFVSWIFTDSTWSQILHEASFAIIKLVLLVFVMSIYIEYSKEQNLVLALRSIWSKLKLKWKWVDDLFIFLELTLRFYPTFQQEWNVINQSKIALGIKQKGNKWEKVKSLANDLPGLIIQSYKKAENTAIVMKQRGYGNIVPRGVVHPILFKTSDLFLILIIICAFVLFNYVTV